MKAGQVRVLTASAHSPGERAARMGRGVRLPQGEHQHDAAGREARVPRVRGGGGAREGPHPGEDDGGLVPPGRGRRDGRQLVMGEGKIALVSKLMRDRETPVSAVCATVSVYRATLYR